MDSESYVKVTEANRDNLTNLDATKLKVFEIELNGFDDKAMKNLIDFLNNKKSRGITRLIVRMGRTSIESVKNLFSAVQSAENIEDLFLEFDAVVYQTQECTIWEDVQNLNQRENFKRLEMKTAFDGKCYEHFNEIDSFTGFHLIPDQANRNNMPPPVFGAHLKILQIQETIIDEEIADKLAQKLTNLEELYLTFVCAVNFDCITPFAVKSPKLLKIIVSAKSVENLNAEVIRQLNDKRKTLKNAAKLEIYLKKFDNDSTAFDDIINDLVNVKCTVIKSCYNPFLNPFILSQI